MANEQILLVEDDPELRSLLGEVLEDAGYQVRPAASGTEAVAALGSIEPALVITDLRMPGLGGGNVLRESRRSHPGVNVIVITAFGSIESAIELVKEGAYDYLTKPFSNDELLLSVSRAMEERALRLAPDRKAGPPPRVPGFVGSSGPIRSLLEMVAKVAKSPLPVLITGETGTGKELVARGIHELSGRKPFLAVNCAALPDPLLESELFGHERGAFTGADKAKPGLLEAADGGTLFLDEVGELPVLLQPKLLRALEEGEIRRVGATRAIRVQVRLLAATNRDLDEEIAAGRFREDLYWRLNGLTLHVPPLRERPADIPVLLDHFLSRFAASMGRDVTTRFAPEAVALLTAYPWPGNVRELRSAVERAATLADSDVMAADALPERIRHGGLLRATVAEAAGKHLSMAEVERAYILEILRVTGGNKSRAADVLGLDRKTLYRKLQEYAEEASGL
jgi:DNA-binding NtrC family response regulator